MEEMTWEGDAQGQWEFAPEHSPDPSTEQSSDPSPPRKIQCRNRDERTEVQTWWESQDQDHQSNFFQAPTDFSHDPLNAQGYPNRLTPSNCPHYPTLLTPIQGRRCDPILTQHSHWLLTPLIWPRHPPRFCLTLHDRLVLCRPRTCPMSPPRPTPVCLNHNHGPTHPMTPH